MADRLADAAKLRNLLVHLYLDVDQTKLWEALQHLDDLSAFAATIVAGMDDAG